MTPSGIEPATCRLVVQSLNHYVTARTIVVVQPKLIVRPLQRAHIVPHEKRDVTNVMDYDEH
jgi:hypothetical protein